MISLPIADEGMAVRPVAREELVYISADPAAEVAGDPKGRREAALVLPETTWRTQDSPGSPSTASSRPAGGLQTRIEVEDVETAVELVARGLADSVVQRGVLSELGPRLAPHVGWVSLRPRLYDTIAVVHRAGRRALPRRAPGHRPRGRADPRGDRAGRRMTDSLHGDPDPPGLPARRARHRRGRLAAGARGAALRGPAGSRLPESRCTSSASGTSSPATPRSRPVTRRPRRRPGRPRRRDGWRRSCPRSWATPSPPRSSASCCTATPPRCCSR